jgi:hypothetical protein
LLKLFLVRVYTEQPVEWAEIQYTRHYQDQPYESEPPEAAGQNEEQAQYRRSQYNPDPPVDLSNILFHRSHILPAISVSVYPNGKTISWIYGNISMMLPL